MAQWDYPVLQRNYKVALQMTTSSNPIPVWTSSVLFRIGGTQAFCWFNYPGEYEPRAAEAAAQKLRCEGLTVLVCTSEQFHELGLPQTYAADEYFAERDYPQGSRPLSADATAAPRRALLSTSSTLLRSDLPFDSSATRRSR